MFKIIKQCRGCKSKELKDILDLGKQPLANDYRIKPKKLIKIPLKIIRCNKCKLIQLSATVNPSKMFSKYFWVTGTSNAVKEYRKKFINRVKKYHSKNDKILEVASNDGFFLKGLKEQKFKKLLGVDPAKNIAKAATKNGIRTIPSFFNLKTSKVIKKQFKPNLIICRNVIPHVENINSVISGLSNLINNNGNVFIEFHYSRNLVEKMHYDYIYHEHVFYYSIQSIENILNKHGLKIFDCFSSPISGGSLVIIASKTNKRKTNFLISKKYEEKKMGINTFKYWKKFASKCIQHRNKVNKILKKTSKSKKIIVGYGASARSSTFLNFCNLSNNNIKFIFDKNRLKDKHYTPGSNIPIKYPKKKLFKNIENIIILAWNFKLEIIKFLKSQKYKKNIITFFPKITYKRI